MAEMDQSLPEETRRAIAENDLELEKALGIKKGAPMSVEKANATSDAIYDLQGRRVAAPRKGIYIKGGRKVVLK